MKKIQGRVGTNIVRFAAVDLNQEPGFTRRPYKRTVKEKSEVIGSNKRRRKAMRSKSPITLLNRLTVLTYAVAGLPRAVRFILAQIARYLGQHALNGGFLAGKRTYIISGIGILSALAAYFVGDMNIFEMMNVIYPLAGIYFLRRGISDSNNKKDEKNANTRKISK